MAESLEWGGLTITGAVPVTVGDLAGWPWLVTAPGHAAPRRGWRSDWLPTPVTRRASGQRGPGAGFGP